MIKFKSLLLAGVAVLPASLAFAQTAADPLPPVEVTVTRAPQPARPAANAGASQTLATPLAGGVVEGQALAAQRPATSDSASLLSSTPGVSLYQAGGVSSLPVIHGLNDDRNAIVLGGVPITASCANHMNPAMSYIDPNAVADIKVLTANVPVSEGGDSIGGSIVVAPRAPAFASATAPAPAGAPLTPGVFVPLTVAPGVIASGSVSGGFRSNGGGAYVAGHFNVATEHFSLLYDGAWAKSGDYRAGGGATVAASKYDVNNHAATLAYRNEDQIITFRYAHQAIPYQGFPNQWMDMLGNNGNIFDLSYKGGFSWGTFEANAYYRITQHYMNFLADRNQTTPMPMYVNGQDFGYRTKAVINVSPTDLARVGNELHMQRLNEWWPPVAGAAPMMGPGAYVNVNNGQRNVLSTYGEWEHRWSQQWSTLLGLRNDTVWMNTGNVQGYSAMYNMGFDGNPGTFGSDTYFNAQDHAKTFVNFDVTATARLSPDAASQYDFGYTLKQRAPSIYELYAWSTNTMAAAMIGWFGDGNGYVGNLDLKPETAHTVSVTGQWSDPTNKAWTVKLTPYYTYVQDYIDVNVLGPSMMGGNILQFANHDAQLAGFDLSGRALVLPDSAIGDVSISGLVGYTYGRRLDGYYLYHMMPINGKIALEDAVLIGGGKLTGAFEVRAVAAKTNVETLRIEPSTPAFAVMNLRASYEVQNLRFDLGVENLADKLYYEPLGGIDISDYMAGKLTTYGQPLAAQGRTVYGGVTVKF